MCLSSLICPFTAPKDSEMTLGFQQSTAIILFFASYCSLLPTVEGIVFIDYGVCAAAVNALYNNDATVPFMLDQKGNPTKNISVASGITYKACKNFVLLVRASSIGMPSLQFPIWLLPWLELTAQLSFETKNRARNFHLLYLVVSCPLLIIYSLTLTILNARAINQELRQIKEDAMAIQEKARGTLFKVL